MPDPKRAHTGSLWSFHERGQIMKFFDMPYERPQVEQNKKEIEKLTEALKNAQSFAQADEVMQEMDKLNDHLHTMLSLANVRHSIDTTDKFYDDEATFIDENMPLLQESLQNWRKALYESAFRPDFEKKYGDLLFRNIELDLKSFSPAIIPEMQRENALTTEYQKLIASAQIPFEGGVYTLSQLTPFKMSADDRIRRAAWVAEGEFYMQNAEKLDSLYDELVKVRDAMGKKLGYDNFVPLGYCNMGRNSYGREEVARFREAVVKYLVPVGEKLQKEKAARLGFEYPLNYADNALSFRDGNATPQGSADDILAHGKTFYHELSPETHEFIDFMFENELFDVLSKKGKAGGGFCTSFPDYRSPFIFANFNGTQGDVEVMTHEAGHAFAGYTARDMKPAEYRHATLDACEIHSMSMEFFAWPWAEGFFGKDTRKFYYSHLANAITFIPYGCMVDHFQHIVYDHPELTPAQRHEEWRKLTAIYMPWIKLDSIPFYGDGRAWQRQQHIYNSPFYYIDYCLAQTVALQFWACMQKDRADAWQRYLSLVRLGGSRPFDQLVKAAGLSVPFEEAALQEVAAAAEQWLGQNKPQ